MRIESGHLAGELAAENSNKKVMNRVEKQQAQAVMLRKRMTMKRPLQLPTRVVRPTEIWCRTEKKWDEHAGQESAGKELKRNPSWKTGRADAKKTVASVGWELGKVPKILPPTTRRERTAC